jgi:hypothetical protein
MVQCTAKDLIGKYVGSTEDIVREKLNEARGGVLLIDEVRMNTQFWMAYGCSVMFFFYRRLTICLVSTEKMPRYNQTAFCSHMTHAHDAPLLLFYLTMHTGCTRRQAVGTRVQRRQNRCYPRRLHKANARDASGQRRHAEPLPNNADVRGLD